MIRMRALVITVLCGAAALGPAPAPAGAAQGSGRPRLAVAPTTLQAGVPATVTVTGTDYLVPPHAPGISVFGGVYLFFGWVRPGAAPWGPSARNSDNNNGVFGVTYSYRGDGGDASTRDDGSGTMRLVSFTPGGESGNATDFHMDDNGNWKTTLRIPSATYAYKDGDGVRRTVDCREVRCGVFTIGAHGKSSVTNERFAPIVFTGPRATPTTQPTQPATPTTPAPTLPPEAAGGGVPVVGQGAEPTAPVATTTVTTAPSAPSTTAKSTTTRVPATTSSTSAAPSTTSGNERALALEPVADRSDGGSSTPWIVLAAVAVIGAAAITGLMLRRRSA